MKISKIKIKQAFIRRFQIFLGRHRSEAIASLKKILKLKLPDPSGQVLFETDEQAWEESLIHVYATNEYSEEMHRRPPFGGRDLFKTPKFPIDWNYFEKHKVDISVLGTNILSDWLSACWQEAGGRDFPYKAFFQHHDDNRYFDLKMKRWKKY